MYPTPEEPEFYGPSKVKEPTTPIGVVLLAAETRRRIEAGERVMVRGLAALCSVSLKVVEVAAAAGEFKAAGGLLSARDARRWAKANDVEGLGKAQLSAARDTFRLPRGQ